MSAGALRISVQLLTGAFHGRADRGAPEWPPSPYRLYQAILAGCRTGTWRPLWTERTRLAFEWLERQPPPRIVAPRARRARELTLAVPNNDMDLVARAWLRGDDDPNPMAKYKTLKHVSPQVIDDEGDTRIHYVWELRSQADREPAQELASAARSLRALGLGIDLAAAEGEVRLDDGGVPPGREWRPSGAGRPTMLRVPTEGSLDSLERRHEAFVGRLNAKSMSVALPAPVHATVGYATPGAVLARRHVEFFLVEADATGQATLTRPIHEISAMARHAAILAAQNDGRPEPWIAAYVAGHGEGDGRSDRFAYLPLPSIGHAHVDGLVRRIVIAGPPGGDAESIAWVAARLEGATLIDEDTRRPVAILSLARERDLVFDRYSRMSSEWQSVTPVILPGHDDGRRSKAEELFLRALEQAGIAEAVRDFQLRREPYWSGARHSREYQVPRYLRGFGRWHAALTLMEACKGPIAVGAGRHLGLGTFAAT